jgi:hypothetical protein
VGHLARLKQQRFLLAFYPADFDGECQRFVGKLQVDMEIAYEDSAFFYLARNDKEDGVLCVDNVSIVLT